MVGRFLFLRYRTISGKKLRLPELCGSTIQITFSEQSSQTPADQCLVFYHSIWPDIASPVLHPPLVPLSPALESIRYLG